MGQGIMGNVNKRVSIFHLPPTAQRTFFVLFAILLLAFFGMQITRIPLVYLNETQTLGIPDTYFSQTQVAHDWNLNVADPGYLLLFGQPINWFWGYGYGPLIAYATLSYMLSTFQICTIDPGSCGYLLYKILILSCFISFVVYALVVPKELYKKLLALLLFLSASLGIGFSRAVEAGNLDLPISCSFAWIVYLISTHTKVKKYGIAIASIIGFVSGFVLTIKLVALPFVLLFFLNSPKKIITVLFFVGTFSLFSLAPNWYGVPTKLTDIYAITETTLKPMRKDVYASYPHGNMTIRASASGAYHLLSLSLPESLRNSLIDMFSLVLLSIITFPSLIYVYVQMRKHKGTIRQFVAFMRFILLPEQIHYTFSLACISLILIPIVAFEYRLIYFIPVFILLIAKEFEKLSYWFFAALFLFFMKNMWILRGSITTLIFYVSLTFLLYEITVQLWNSFLLSQLSTKSVKR